jgi:MFS transporter, DHA3 family, macrolide efflux protein
MFQSKNMFLFTTNDFVTGLGNSVFNILIMWYVYDVTGSAISTAIIGSYTHISSFLIGPLAGVYADRSNRPLSLFTWTLRINAILLLVMALCIFFFSGSIEIFAVYVLVALREITFTMEYPIQTRIIPLIVPENYVTKLIGYRSVTGNVSSLIGNSISGFVIASIGVVGGLMLNSITFFIGAMLISFLQLIPKEDNEAKEHENAASYERNREKVGNSIWYDVKQGLKTIWSNDSLRKITILSSLINIVSMVGPMFVVYFQDYLESSSQSYGIFQAMVTSGSILSGIVIGMIVKKVKNSTIIVTGWLMLAVLFLMMYFNTNIWITFAIGVFLGVGLTLPGITLESVRILIIPDQYRGRVSTTMQAISVVLIPLSNLLGGMIADYFGANAVFLVAGTWQFIMVIMVYINRSIFNLSDK